MAKYNGPVADAIEEILNETLDYRGHLVEDVVEQVVDLVTGFMLAGWDQGHTLQQTMNAWQRGAVG